MIDIYIYTHIYISHIYTDLHTYIYIHTYMQIMGLERGSAVGAWGVLAEDPGLILGIHTVWTTGICNSSSKGFRCSGGPGMYAVVYIVHRHTCTCDSIFM